MSKHPYDMITPCPDCPFRKDKAYLTAERAEQICHNDGEFPCHKTTVATENDDGSSEMEQTKNSKICAGFLILREKIDHPNQMMRIAERIGMYSRKKLMEDNPSVDEIFDSIQDMVDAQDS